VVFVQSEIFMAEYRIEGTSDSGKPVSGVINAVTFGEAKKRAHSLAAAKKFKLKAVRQRSTFIYRVQRGKEKPIDGEQKAFSKQEVEDALKKMGLKVVYVRKKLFDFKPRPPMTEIVTFVRVSADLIRQKLPYNEVLQMMVNDITNNTLRETVRDINLELKQGKDGEKVYQKHEKVFGRFTSHMLGLASKSGNMAEIFDNTAKFLERQAQFRKDLKSALIMPVVTLLVTFAALLYFVMYIFPTTAKLFVQMNIDLPPITAATLTFSEFLFSNMLWLSLAFIVPLFVALKYFTSEKGRFVRDKYIWKLPVVGSLLHKTNIEIFCRVFYSLYTGSGENIDIIRLASEACGNKYMESQIKKIAIPLMVEKGAGLTEAFEATGVFTPTAISRFNTGAETGSVKQSAQQIADYYEKETTYKMKAAIDMIQVFMAVFIMLVLIYITVASAETAIIRPKNPMVGMLEVSYASCGMLLSTIGFLKRGTKQYKEK
jgi:type IV pilus assembly protein PilC